MKLFTKKNVAVLIVLAGVVWYLMNPGKIDIDKLTMNYEQQKQEYIEAQELLLLGKLSIANDCIKEDYERCKIGSDGVVEVTKRLHKLLPDKYDDWKPRYDTPDDLFYTYLKEEGVYISQTPQEHYSANGLLAADVATGQRPLRMYAPDLKGEWTGWNATRWYDYPELGDALVLTKLNQRFIIGHISSNISDGDYVPTGTEIGVTLCPGDPKAGATTGCHAHIMYQVATDYPSENPDWQAAEYKIKKNYLKHDEWKEKRDKAKEYADNNYWIISSYYTPVQGQSSYYNGSYEKDFEVNCHGNCLSPADGKKLLTQEDKYQIVACPKQFPLGTKFKITLPEDHEQYPNKSWVVTCRDRGGAIRTADTNKKGQSQLDLWSGIGVPGEKVPWIGEMSTRKAIVEVL